MKTLRDIPKLENIPVLVRAALNVPIENDRVVNDYRLRRALPTIQFLAERHAKVILISHMGEAGTETLKPVAEALERLHHGVSFCDATVGPVAREAIRKLSPGSVLVLENLRRDKGELKNDLAFAKEVAALGDVFVEDSFDTCHRAHASIVGVPALLPSYAGLLLEEEIRELSAALTPKTPSLAVIGGAKFSTKEGVLETLLKQYDKVFVGGALASDFLKAAGHEVGKSLVSPEADAKIKKLLKHPKLLLPVDAVVLPFDALDALDRHMRTRVATIDDVKPNEMILDHGPGTSLLLAERVKSAKAILWNGPLGNYERNFVDATDSLAKAVAKSGAHSVVGGGDTVASIEKLGILSRFSFVSTGGGAMLEFLGSGTLVGVEALSQKA